MKIRSSASRCGKDSPVPFRPAAANSTCQPGDSHRIRTQPKKQREKAACQHRTPTRSKAPRWLMTASSPLSTAPTCIESEELCNATLPCAGKGTTASIQDLLCRLQENRFLIRARIDFLSMTATLRLCSRDGSCGQHSTWQRLIPIRAS